MLAATLGYELEGLPAGVVATLTVAGLLVADALRRGGLPGLWLVALGFCAALSRLNVTQTETALGVLRGPLIVGGSLLAFAFGYIVDPEFRPAIKRAHP
jgi:acyl-CoA synthetase (NDP forming)